MVQDQIHKAISEHQAKLPDWFLSKRGDGGLGLPFYSSFDIRDSGFKVVPVDANLFPAGFNNICQTDKDSSVDLVRDYLDQTYSPAMKRVALLTEEHTNNPYYWDNVHTLQTLLEQSGREVRVVIPSDLPEPLSLQSASGHRMTVHTAKRSGDGLDIEGFIPEVVISNNDFSNGYEEWALGLKTSMNPPRELGWHRRKKSDFFTVYNELATEFSQLIGVDPWLLTVATEKFSEFDINEQARRNALADRVQEFLDKIRNQYVERGIEKEPTVFIKNNSGTYGLGVIKAASADEIRTWNNKSRKKMKAAKGGGGFAEVIIQEGVPTAIQAEGETAEPAIYMIGCQLAGGFLRTHGKKGPDDSLNSPGAVYKRLCLSDLNINVEGHPMENVYGWVGKLGFLAIALEARSQGVVIG